MDQRELEQNAELIVKQNKLIEHYAKVCDLKHKMNALQTQIHKEVDMFHMEYDAVTDYAKTSKIMDSDFVNRMISISDKLKEYIGRSTLVSIGQ